MNETIVQFEKIPIPYRASEYVRVYAPLTVLDAHAAEVVRDGDDYYLLSVFYPENGVSAARLAFRNDD